MTRKSVSAIVALAIVCCASITTVAAQSFGNGVHVVGRDISPGTYRTKGGEFCVWERLRGFSGEIDDTIAIDISQSGAVVAIAASDRGFKSVGCSDWESLDHATGGVAPFSVVLADALVGEWFVSEVGSDDGLYLTLLDSGQAATNTEPCNNCVATLDDASTGEWTAIEHANSELAIIFVYIWSEFLDTQYALVFHMKWQHDNEICLSQLVGQACLVSMTRMIR